MENIISASFLVYSHIMNSERPDLTAMLNTSDQGHDNTKRRRYLLLNVTKLNISKVFFYILVPQDQLNVEDLMMNS